jgi:hypothetical protein
MGFLDNMIMLNKNKLSNSVRKLSFQGSISMRDYANVMLIIVVIKDALIVEVSVNMCTITVPK